MTNVEEGAGDERTALKPNHEMTGADHDSAPLTKPDPYAVEFVNGRGKSDDVLLDIKLKDDPSKEEEFVGLKKEELEKFAADPYWVRMRIILLVLFGLVWVGMLVAAIVIIVVAPKCPPRPNQDWWEAAVVYQLNPNSFLDTSGDGKGDIKGIHNKLDYLEKSLGVSAVNIGPFYPAPSDGFGYDVLDFNSICGHYGTEEDFKSLRVAMHKKGMKLILDFIPNHTSKKHKWFKMSQNGSLPENKYKDFYIWHGGLDINGTKQPPNNWLNAYGQSAWTFSEARNEYYYHSYSADEPDLNLTNPDVVHLLDDALLFWLGQQVDGFRFIGADRLVEPSSLEAPNMEIQPKTYELIKRWRDLLDNYSFSSELPKSRRFPRVMIADISRSINETGQFFENGGHLGAHLPTIKSLLSLGHGCDTNCVYSKLKDWSPVIQSNSKIANWQVGNSNTSRIVTRMGDQSYTNAINMLLLTLPGTAMVYNGDELGMKDAILQPETRNYSLRQDLLPRAGQNSPMQWSDRPNAGFSTADPFLPVADDYAETNVEAQTAHGSGMSHVKVFKKLATLKAEPSLSWGQLKIATEKSALVYTRQAEGFPGYLIAINFGPRDSTITFKNSALKDQLPDSAKIAASTENFEGVGRSEHYALNTEIKLGDPLILKQKEGIILKFDPPQGSFLF